MKGKNIVLTVAIVAACAGVAMAAPNAPQAKMVKTNTTPTRMVPGTIAPVYLIDGVEVIGQEIPYTDVINPAVAGYLPVYDQYDGDPDQAAAYPPADRGGPCGGAGFRFVANTDSSSSDYFHVRVVHATDDFKGMNPAGVGQAVKGLAYLWNHASSTEGMRIIVRILDNFNENNDPNFGAAGARARTYSGAQSCGVQITYYGQDGVTLGAPVNAGFYYTYIDISALAFPSPLLDTDGAVNFQLLNPDPLAVPLNAPNAKDQVAFWGTRTDELPAPQSLPRFGGQQNPFIYIDDAGALGSAPYVLANAVTNSIITPAGADGGPNESYATGPSTDPLDCFRSTGLCWALFTAGCVAQDAATLVSPADGATGVTNNFPGPSFEWAPGATISTDYSCNIYQNNALVHTMNGILTTTFDLDIALAAGCYEWSMVSNGGGSCPGAESARNEFAMVGSDCNPPCAADFNGDTVVDFFDYLDFVDAFSANDPSADFNNDTVIDFFDYLDFVDAFSAGC